MRKDAASASGPIDRYRKDIDGLRAVAVSLVVLFHATRYVPGGFVGVDVFFVISGYLITLHIVKEMDAGRFTIASFYEKRIRRIFPALLVMLFASFIAASQLLLPGEFVDYAKSLLWSVLSVSNFYFWKHSDYFASPLLPLQHTWSLAVEEQFYLLFPAFLLVLRRLWPERLKAALVVCAIASFLLSAATVLPFPVATFYLIPARAWELILGGLLAVGVFPKLRRSGLCEVLSMLGLALILIAGFVITSATPFPGTVALLPCLGAALIIAANDVRSTLVGRILSLPPLVGLGLISYSLYLWHWPIIIFKQFDLSFTFGRLIPHWIPSLSPSQAASLERIAFILVVSLAAAYLSWRFVEQPIRFGPLRPNRKQLFTGAAAASVSLLFLALASIGAHGLPGRFFPRTLAIASATVDHRDYQQGTCFIAAGDRVTSVSQSCLTPDPSKRNWLIIGDSHGAQLYHGLSLAFPSVHILQATAIGCKGVILGRFGETSKCRKIMESTFYGLLPGRHPDLVILASRWESFDLDRLGATVHYLQKLGIKVVVVGPTPRYDAPLPRLLAVGVQRGQLDLAASHRLGAYDGLDREMARLAATEWRVPYISYMQLLCSQGECLQYAAPDVPMQADGEHLSDLGSVVFAERLKQSGILFADER